MNRYLWIDYREYNKHESCINQINRIKYFNHQWYVIKNEIKT